MNHRDIIHITAVTEVKSDGQKCTAAVIEYKAPIDGRSLGSDTYDVRQRTVTGVECIGRKVTITLDERDENAATYHPGMPWKGIPPTLTEAKVFVCQRRDIRTAGGDVIAGSEEYLESDHAHDALADTFLQAEFGQQKYNLYIPKDYDPNKKYPLIQFIHDAAVCGKETRLALAQGMGAVIWAAPGEQNKHPCFVFAPQFDGPPIVDDDWNVDPRLEKAKAALDHVVEMYSIDKNRIYTTGQSMGCMASIVLNVRYPGYFAASYLVAGQWDERGIPGLERQKLWMLCSQGDAKAFPTMNQMCVNMERAGAVITRRVIEAGLSDDEYKKIADEITREKPDIIFTPYKLETVADGWHSNGGEHHIDTWQTAYDIEPIRDWLFAQSKEDEECS